MLSNKKKTIIFSIFVLLCVLLLSGSAQADITAIVSGLNGAYGSDYTISSNRAYFVERYAGSIHRINMSNHSDSIIGIGYNEPMDIVVTADGAHAYVVENGSGGSLLYIDLANANRAAAAVISSNISPGGIVGQIALDEAHNYAYVIENSSGGKLRRINLLNGDKTELLTNFDTAPFGLLLTNDLQYAYYTELGLTGKLKRLNMITNAIETLVTGLSNPTFMDWANDTQSAILVPVDNQILSIDLTSLSQTPIVTGLGSNNRSVTRMSDDSLLSCVHSIVYEVTLSTYSSSGPIILGIGHVPFDRIIGGYADTTVDPGYFYQVKDAPFGGTLAIMINHTGAYNKPHKARYYKLLVDGVEPRQSWTDYRWNAVLNRFVLEAISPDSNGYYKVREPGDIWYNHWLGYRLNTTGLTNGAHTITLRLYKANKQFVGGVYNLTVQIDNLWPTANINQILQDNVPIQPCAIVSTPDGCAFNFNITANDPDGHLSSWSLYVNWGDNQSQSITSDNYTSHLPGPIWSGISDTVVPVDSWCAPETCAYTFYLSVWDRAIDGYNHIHWSGYHKSLTIMINPF